MNERLQSIAKQTSELMPFEQTVANIYGRNKFVPLNHAADALYDKASEVIRRRSERTSVSFLDKPKLKLWASKPARLAMDGIDVTYSLMAERNTTLRSRMGAQVLHIVLNEDFYMPAALLLPRKQAGESAAVVVGDMVNEPSHIQELGEIIRHISDASCMLDPINRRND